MSGNPYAPPKAAVSDAPEPPRVRPRSVKIAVALLWIELVFMLVAFAIAGDTSVGTLEAEYKLFIGIFMFITVVVSVWINIKIWQGRNWARIVGLVFTILALPTLLQLPATLREDVLVAGMNVVSTGLDVAAMILVFGPGADWFRRRS